MFAKIGMKKRLLVAALAMAMVVSCVCGLFSIGANAADEGVFDTAQLVTVMAGDATVSAATKYTMKGDLDNGTAAAGTEVGTPGLYIDQHGDKVAYAFAVNGLFNDSFGMKFRVPGEGYWNPYKEIVFTVQSLASPSSRFEVHMGGQWQAWGYVAYDWDGTTLYRSRHKDNDTIYTTLDECRNINLVQFFPHIGAYGDKYNHDNLGYFGIEKNESGAYDIVMWNTGGARKVLATFSEDPDSYNAGTAVESGNLPKLDMSDGYTVEISVSEQAENNTLDFLIDSFATSATGDPYAEGGTQVSMQNATLESAPSFYTAWQNAGKTNDMENLVSLGAGVQATPAVQYVAGGTFTESSASPAVSRLGTRGMLIAPQELGNGTNTYKFSFNGVFKGDTNILWSVPGESGTAGETKRVVFTVTSVSNPQDTFRVVWQSPWQSTNYVEYTYPGRDGVSFRTLYRAADPTYNTNGDDVQGIVYYALASDGGALGGGDSNTKIQYAPQMGVLDWGGTAAEPGLFRLEQQNGAMNVQAVWSKDGNVALKTMASFCDEYSSFTPTDKLESAEGDLDYNLPRLDMEDGYTISVEVTTNARFMLHGIETENDIVDCKQENYLSTPFFYTDWQNTTLIGLDDFDYLYYLYKGLQTELPVPTVTKGGAVQDVTPTVTVTPSNQSGAPYDGGAYTFNEVGQYTIVYSVAGERDVTLVCYVKYDSGKPIEEIVTASGAQVTQGANSRGRAGLTVSNGGKAAGYSGSLAGKFFGDMSIDFEFPHSFTNGVTNNEEFTFTICDTEGNAVFDVVYRNVGWATAVYVRMGDAVRALIEDGSGDNWSNEQCVMYYRVPTGEECLVYPGAGTNYTDGYGTLQLVWGNDGVLNVRVTDRNHNYLTLAAFDGSQPYSGDDMQDGKLILDMDEARPYGLPKLDGSGSAADLHEGFTVKFSSSTGTLPVTFLAVNGISLGVLRGLALTSDSAMRLYAGEKAFVEGSTVYVMHEEDPGTVHLVYANSTFANAGAQFAASWSLDGTVINKPIADLQKEMNAGQQYPIELKSADYVSGGGYEDYSFTLNVENRRTLSFDLGGGQTMAGAKAVDSIDFSDHTRFLLSVPELERAFWVFDGWKWSAGSNGADWNNSFDSLPDYSEDAANVTFTAKWKDVTPATVVLNGVKSETIIAAKAGAQFTISKKDVIASDAAQPEKVQLTVEYKKEGDSDWTTMSEDSVTISVGEEEAVWEIRYTVTDQTNGDVSITRTVRSMERAAPVITVGSHVDSVYKGFGVNVNVATAVDFAGEPVDVTVNVYKDGALYNDLVKNGVFTPTETGVYKVVFTAKDSVEETLIGYAEMIVTVLADTEAPVIDVTFEDRVVQPGTTITLPSAVANDNADADVQLVVTVTYGTESVTVQNNSFVAEKAGTYTITWTAKDSAGNNTTRIARVTVAPEGPAGGTGGVGGGGATVWVIVGVAAVVVAAAVVTVVLVVRKKKKAAAAAEEYAADEDGQNNDIQ